MNVLHVRRADLAEQIGASLYYTYVLKRHRPYGGLDPALERKILAARKRSMGLLTRALKTDPPRQVHARLEWAYLLGELQRLIGDTKGAAISLRTVCESQREAGYTIGRLACEMADRAAKNESWEDYRDGVFDARNIEAAEKDADRRRAEAERAHAEAERAKAEEERARAEAAKRGAAAPTPTRPIVPLPSQPSPTDDPLRAGAAADCTLRPIDPAGDEVDRLKPTATLARRSKCEDLHAGRLVARWRFSRR